MSSAPVPNAAGGAAPGAGPASQQTVLRTSGLTWRVGGFTIVEDVALAVAEGEFLSVIGDYRLHPEAKFLGADGETCARATRGVLDRRPVHVIGTPTLIGKEANRLDDVQHGLIAEVDEVLTTYVDPTAEHEILHDLVLPVLDRYSGRELAQLVGCDRRQIDRIRQG